MTLYIDVDIKVWRDGQTTVKAGFPGLICLHWIRSGWLEGVQSGVF
jgi:hypothetical protein